MFDACVLGDPAVVTGNLAKIMVGFVGMAFNVIMLFQVRPHAAKAGCILQLMY